MTESLQRDDRVIWRDRLATVVEVVDKPEIARAPVVIIRLDSDHTLAPVALTAVSRVDPNQADSFYFSPGASMERVGGGWRLKVDWGDSQQGASIGGVIVDDPAHIPDAQAASEALDAWLKRSPAHRKGQLVFTLRNSPGAPPLQSGAVEDGPHGHCDTCGVPCDENGCTRDRGHVAALDVDDPLRPLTLTRGKLLDLLTTACLIGRNEDHLREVQGWVRGDFTEYLARRLRSELIQLEEGESRTNLDTTADRNEREEV